MSAEESVSRAGPVVTTGDAGEEMLARAGYKPELRRSLRFFSMFAIAFSIISITTGIFLNYSFGRRQGGGLRRGPGSAVVRVRVALAAEEGCRRGQAGRGADRLTARRQSWPAVPAAAGQDLPGV